MKCIYHPSKLYISGDMMVARDKNDNLVILLVYEWGIQRLLEGNKGLKLLEMAKNMDV